MKIGIIGVRGHTNYVVNALGQLPDATIAGACDGDCGDDLSGFLARLDELEQATTVYDEYATLLAEEELDVVCIAGPFERTSEYILAAAATGARILTEKPVANNYEDLRALAAAIRAPVQVTPMMALRFAPAFYTAWAAVKGGAVGDIRLIHAQKSYRMGERPTFFHARETSTGLIPWVGSHAFDWIWWFTGSQARRVYASHSQVGNYGHGDLEASAACHVLLDNGIQATVNLDFLRPATARSHGDDRLRVVGTDGIVEVRDDVAYLMNADKDGELELLDPPPIFPAMLLGGAMEGAVPTFRDAVQVTALALAARESADRRMPLEVPII